MKLERIVHAVHQGGGDAARAFATFRSGCEKLMKTEPPEPAPAEQGPDPQAADLLFGRLQAEGLAREEQDMSKHRDSSIEVRWSTGQPDGNSGVHWFGNDLQAADDYARGAAAAGYEVLLIEWAPDMVTARQERTY